MSNIVPLAMISAVTSLDSSLDGWTLLDVPASEPRVFRYDVAFDQPFPARPLVHLSISGIDVENHDCARLRAHPVDIRPDGFTIHLETWLNTRIWSVDVSWLAVGQAH